MTICPWRNSLMFVLFSDNFILILMPDINVYLSTVDGMQQNVSWESKKQLPSKDHMHF